jgi:hypothetical protein
MIVVEHPESYEVRRLDGKALKYFFFENDPARRDLMGRMTKKQAEQAARAFVGSEGPKAKGK